MLQLKQYFNRSLTGRETVVILAIAAMLAGVGYLAYEFVTAKVLETKVNAAIPTVSEKIRAQRAKLVSAIEAYKAHFGAYPPDHVISRQPLIVDSVTNTLLYELSGVIYDSTNKMFELSHLEAAEEKYVKQFFQIDGFKNCAQTTDKLKRFLTDEPLPALQLHDDPDVFALGYQVSYDGLAPEVVWEFQISPWRYVSSSPTNNPGKFDLWVDVKTKNRNLVIGNWKDVQ
jgi:hypothetical protein